LGPFDGLQLVLAGKSAQPAFAAIVVADDRNAASRSDAEDAGAAFLLRPVRSDDLVAALRRMVRLHNEVGEARQSPAAPMARDPAPAAWKTRGNEARRQGWYVTAPVGHTLDLHGRLEHKRQEIERERRVFVRRCMDRVPAERETPHRRGLTP
jgi:hypothetical protein